MHTGSEGPCPLIQFGISKRAGGCLDLLLVFTSGPHVSPDHLCFTSEREMLQNLLLTSILCRRSDSLAAHCFITAVALITGRKSTFAALVACLKRINISFGESDL